MAFPNSGAVSLNAFADEVGDSDNIHSMSEFYRKSAGPVYDIGDNSDIPTSGAISFSQLRGTSGVAFRSTSQGVQDNPAGANTLAAYFNSADRTNKVCHLTVDTTIGANVSISTGNFASGDPLYVDINSTNGAIHGTPGNAGNTGTVDTTNGAANNPNSGNQGGHGLTVDGNQTVKLSPGSDTRIIGGGGGGGGAGIYNVGNKGNGATWQTPNNANYNAMYVIPPYWNINSNISFNIAGQTLNFNPSPGFIPGNVTQAFNNATNGNPPANFADNSASPLSTNPGNAGSPGSAGNAGNNANQGIAPAVGNTGSQGQGESRNNANFSPNPFSTFSLPYINYNPLQPIPTSGWAILATSGNWRMGAHSHPGIYSGQKGSMAVFYYNANVNIQHWRVYHSNSNHFQFSGGNVINGNTGNKSLQEAGGGRGNAIPAGSGGVVGQRYPGTPANTHSNVSFGDLDPGTNP